MKSLRDTFSQCLLGLAARDERIIVIDCDTGGHLRLDRFLECYPKRFVQAGIAEQHAVSLAAGYARAGFRPVVGAFASFLGSRGFEQARLSVGLQNLPVIFLGTHAGFAASEDGPSHLAFDDIALFRLIPNMRVVTPGDRLEVETHLKACMSINAPVYFRLGRDPVGDINSKFTHEAADPGIRLLSGSGKYTIISCGEATHEVVRALTLVPDAHDFRLLHISRIEPLPNLNVYLPPGEVPVIICIEDHYGIGGLTSAVAESLNGQAVCLYGKYVLKGFGETGSESRLREAAGLNADEIARFLSTIVAG